jgi:hypothetical protein
LVILVNLQLLLKCPEVTKNIWIFILVFLSSCDKSNTYNSSFPASKTYYVDSGAGNNLNAGLSQTKAWASLEKVNSIVFEPGDKILFKAGTSYQGQLAPKGSGSGKAPVIIDVYGKGNKPVINGMGNYNATLLLKNQEYWEINNLDITNKGAERKAGQSGVTILAEDFGDCHHIYLNGLEIHDVNGSLVKQAGGGRAIYWKNSGTKILTRFVDLRIENCHLYRCERNGINSSGYTSRSNWHPSVGIIIRNNLLEQIPGDGIVPIGCDGAIIEYNIMRDSPDILPSTEAAAGIWPWSSDNTIIQYNEVSGHNAKIDGQGLDSDWNCQNTIIQYNYSHDNAGGFLLVCNNGTNIGTDGNIGTTNTIVRYNVSINDGIRLYPTRNGRFFSPLMHISGPVSNTQIYNNLFIVPAKQNDSIDISLIQMDNWGGPWPVDSRFSNNIFYIEKKADFSWGSAVNTRFDNNLFKGEFINLPVINNGPLFSDPMIVNPGARGIGLYMLVNFKLKSGSPCIGAGIRVDNNGGYDLFGNSLANSGLPSIGVHEYK